MSIIVLDIQHGGSPNTDHIADRGAVYDGVEEVTLTRRYADAADRQLRKLGHQVIVISDGNYSDRQARAEAYGAAVYVALHINAGQGNYGLVFHDYRSSKGPLLAKAIVGQMGKHFTWSQRVAAASPGDPLGGRAWNCIKGVGKPVSILLEPGFIDGPHRADLIARIEEVGVALADGIHQWSLQ